MKVLLGAVFAFVIALVMGLPTYGFIQALRFGTYDFDNSDASTVGWVLLCGLPWVGVFAGLVWFALGRK